MRTCAYYDPAKVNNDIVLLLLLLLLYCCRRSRRRLRGLASVWRRRRVLTLFRLLRDTLFTTGDCTKCRHCLGDDAAGRTAVAELRDDRGGLDNMTFHGDDRNAPCAEYYIYCTVVVNIFLKKKKKRDKEKKGEKKE